MASKETGEGSSSHKGQRINSYDIKFKLKVITYAKDHGNRQAAGYFKVDRKRVREWRSQEDKLREIDRPCLRKRIDGGCRKVGDKDIDDQVLALWSRRRTAGVRVTGTSLKQEVMRLHKANGNQNFKASCGWLRSFIKRHRLTYRRTTHIGQKSEDLLSDRVQGFLRYVIRLRQRHSYPMNCILNMDETPIWLDMPGDSTIEKKGIKSVNMTSTGHEKARVTVMLGAKADSTKLKPVIVFKGVRPPREIPVGVIVKMTPNAWANEEVIKFWLCTAYGRNNSERRLLVWDSLTTHRVPSVKQMLTHELNSDYAVIPGGCTSRIQPCDVSWNRPFKDAFRESYDAWLFEGPVSLTPKGNRRPPEKEKIMQWIKSAWASVTPEVVRKSFVKCGISSALDGSQDDLLGASDDEDADPFAGFTEGDVDGATQLVEALGGELDALNEYSDQEEDDESEPEGEYDCPNSPGH